MGYGATGFVAVADAWACTNPSAGRGLTVGFLHALELRNVLRETSGRPRETVEAFDARTEAEIAPWYHAQRAVDHARFAEMEAAREGREPPKPTGELAPQIIGLLRSMMADPDLFRAAIEYISTVTPVQRILQRPDVAERLRAASEALKHAPPIRMPGPTRQQLLELAV